ncbi:MAG TPA: TIGR01777 family oxidoreductase [Cyclobacteriaceae bacterium]|nr:TIGR01777 family oxidoreductase [Cyclobacteriaceae bacterium]
MAERVLITGGTGMIGGHLKELLHKEGYITEILSRKTKQEDLPNSWHWDIDKGELDIESIRQADHIIHLCGAGLARSKWTAGRKKEILDSRVKSTNLLLKALSENRHNVKTIISASAIGYYGWNTGSIMMDEERKKPGDDFLAVVVRDWEASSLKFSGLGIRTVILRNGQVLSLDGGMVKKLILPVKFWMGAPFGNGEQYISWIHIEDLCRIILKAIKDESFKGVYNAVAPGPVTNKEFIKIFSRCLNKSAFLPGIPPFLLKLFLGEMASMILGGNKVSSEKIESAGYSFKFRNINDALKDLLSGNV